MAMAGPSRPFKVAMALLSEPIEAISGHFRPISGHFGPFPRCTGDVKTANWCRSMAGDEKD